MTGRSPRLAAGRLRRLTAARRRHWRLPSVSPTTPPAGASTWRTSSAPRKLLESSARPSRCRSSSDAGPGSRCRDRDLRRGAQQGARRGCCRVARGAPRPDRRARAGAGPRRRRDAGRCDGGVRYGGHTRRQDESRRQADRPPGRRRGCERIRALRLAEGEVREAAASGRAASGAAPRAAGPAVARARSVAPAQARDPVRCRLARVWRPCSGPGPDHRRREGTVARRLLVQEKWEAPTARAPEERSTTPSSMRRAGSTRTTTNVPCSSTATCTSGTRSRATTATPSIRTACSPSLSTTSAS